MFGGTYLAKDALEGNIYQISFDKNNIIKGWLLFVSDEGNEYLIKRNTILNSKVKRKLFQSNISLKNFRVDYKASNKTNYKNIGIGVGLILSAILRTLLPSYIFYESIPSTPFTGFLRVFIFIMMLLISFKLIAIWRKVMLEKNIKRLKGELNFIGYYQPLSPIKITKNGNKVW